MRSARESCSLGLLLLGGAACLMQWLAPWAALCLGMLLALSLGNPRIRATQRLQHLILQLAVVGLGAGVDLAVVGAVGLRGIGYTLAGLCLTFAFGYWLGRRLGLGDRLSTLLCAGTGICGGSAIAATSTAIRADAGEAGTALATVFSLNGVALIVFPPLGHLLGLTAHQFGLWSALAIHDTSSVTGAAMSFGPEALSLATTVKLARALWIVPVSLALGWWFSRRAPGGAGSTRPGFPWFIAGFLALSAFFTWTPGVRGAIQPAVSVAKSLLTLALFLIGAGLSREVLKSAGLRPLIAGLLLWIVVSSGTLAAILSGLIT